MSFHDRTYTILPIDSLSGVNFSQVMETSSSTIRKNNDESQFVIKYKGIEPSSISGVTKVQYDGRDFHTHEEILQIMSLTGTTGWTTNDII